MPTARIALVAALLAAPAALAQGGPPEHLVTFMAAAGQTECPDRWTEAGYALGRLVLGTNDPGEVGRAAGTPMADATLPAHDHGFDVSGTVGSRSWFNLPFGSEPRGAGGGVSAESTTAPAAVALPFIQFLICEHTAAPAADSLPFGAVGFFNAGSCPADWQPVDQADGRFLLPAGADLSPGYATEETWDPARPPTHTHRLSSSFETGEAERENFEGTASGFAQPGRVALDGTAAAAGPVLPFVSLLVCERVEGFGNSGGVPPGTTIFFGSKDCPSGWGETIGADGRLIVGIGGNGTQGATFGADPIDSGPTKVRHRHAFSGSVELHRATDGAAAQDGRPRIEYVTAGPFDFNGVSDRATEAVPYLVLQSCTKE